MCPEGQSFLVGVDGVVVFELELKQRNPGLYIRSLFRPVPQSTSRSSVVDYGTVAAA